ncbi:MAG: TonB family protein [Betaproteobacteria bacterium]
MDFARQQRDPARHLIGITFVVLVHGLVIWALVTGLARKAIDVIKKPLTATIIEEIKAPPPPPPPPKKIEQPKVEQPQQTYVPPPDIPVQTTQTDAPTISAVTATPPPPQQYVIAPPAVVAPPPAPPKPAVRRGVVRLGGDDPVYPRAAIKAGIDKGQVVAQVKIDEKGNVYEVVIISATPPRHFDRAVIEALMTWKFKAEGEKYVGEVEVNFSLKD